MLKFSNVENAFLGKKSLGDQKSKIPYIKVENFPDLGLLTSLRFLEWVSINPNGVISLPTGKTPEYFIKWTHYLLQNWGSKKVDLILRSNGFVATKKPNLSNLRFVQIDEFYPLDAKQKNSFFYYVNKYYLDGFGLSKKNALLINSNEIKLTNNSNWKTIFPTMKVDLSLRYRNPKNDEEEQQQKSIFIIDQWCSEYEQKIRDLGGIGFFLGGIGPDGHIAFNIRGSSHNSTTRLMNTNFETQAAAATDLGGIEVSKNRLVITIGLGTITYNPDVVAIIIAAGESKAEIVKKSLENSKNIKYPATVLNNFKNSRFYLTNGAAKKLKDTQKNYWLHQEWDSKKQQEALLYLAKKKNIFGKKLTVSDIKSDTVCKNIPNLDKNTVLNIIRSIDKKVQKGMHTEKNQTYYHTGPHHDDIMLGMMPHIIHLIREPTNKHFFTNMTSGFTSVTNKFVLNILEETMAFILKDKIQMLKYADFFTSGFKRKWDKDVYHYLDGIANDNKKEQFRGLAHRIVRIIIKIYKIKDKVELLELIKKISIKLKNSYDGEKNTSDVQKFKGMIRE